MSKQAGTRSTSRSRSYATVERTDGRWPIRVAVVDDDSSVREALSRLLKAAAFDVATYSSGTELLAQLGHFDPCCIVLDLHMPGLSGLDIQRHLTQINSTTPVIVITGHDSSRTRSESLSLGASAYFAKPVEGDNLVAAIRKAAAGRSPATE